jgi:hypothetical protein
MPRNNIKGKNTRPGSNKATGRDLSYQKAYNARPEERKRRSELSKIAHERGIYGKRHEAGKDLSHTKDGKVVLEDRSKNRARNRGKK